MFAAHKNLPVATAVVLILAAAVWPGLASASWDDCNQAADPRRTIAGCTAVIRAGQSDRKNTAIAYYNRGNAHDELTQYRRAIKDYDLAIRIDPGYALAYNNRAWAFHKLGQPANGLPDADKALALEPKEANFLNTRAHLFEDLGQRDKAIADYRLAVALDPKDQDSREALKRLGVAP